MHPLQRTWLLALGLATATFGCSSSEGTESPPLPEPTATVSFDESPDPTRAAPSSPSDQELPSTGLQTAQGTLRAAPTSDGACSISVDVVDGVKQCGGKKAGVTCVDDADCQAKCMVCEDELASNSPAEGGDGG